MATLTPAQMILLEEYRQLYSLVLFRLQALDQRIPIFTAVLSVLLSQLTSDLGENFILYLPAMPLAAIWLLRLTLIHAQALEDAFRRIEAIERELNAGLSSLTIGYQSTHPGRRGPGGRTGRTTIEAVAVFSTIVLAISLVQVWDLALIQPHVAIALSTWLGGCAAGMIVMLRRFARYAYRPRRMEATFTVPELPAGTA
jgi:hypothetical protein